MCIRDRFNTAFILHIGIAIIVLFLAETVGLWLLFEKLNIPDERMSAAVWVYQFSIISSMVSITQVPYNATLISHEKMDVYAIVAVSYTHLDVYKRQVLSMLISVYNENWVKDKNQIAVSTSMFINERLGVIERELGNVDEDISSYKSEHLLPDVQAASVSYTHLDVYKRQNKRRIKSNIIHIDI